MLSAAAAPCVAAQPTAPCRAPRPGSAPPPRRRRAVCARSAVAAPPSAAEAEAAVYAALRRVIDPDFGADIVECGFVKQLVADPASGRVSFTLELTTPACPVKDEFEAKARAYVSELGWVTDVEVSMTAAASASPFPAAPAGLRGVSHIVAVASCKGGVGKSTVAVNLAYTLAMMGARVGILDADIYGPSLPTMTSPDPAVLEMDAETRAIRPCSYQGVKLVSFGFTGQGAAIMRGPMVSGVIQQLVTSTEWGSLDYLVLDLPPGTGDIHLTLCQLLPIAAAVVVTTPQKLASVDVVKGVRMFARLRVPTVALVQNMATFAAAPGGPLLRPFGPGCGPEVVRQFGIPHLFELPIEPALSAAGDAGTPFVCEQPASATAAAFGALAAAMVQEVAKLGGARSANPLRASYDPGRRLICVSLADGRRLELHPAFVRRNDCSAKSVDEWTGARRAGVAGGGGVAEDVAPSDLGLLGNYALQISWPDGLNQVAPLDQLEALAAAAAAAGRGSGEGMGALEAARWPLGAAEQ